MPKTYELRVFQGRREVDTPNRLRDVLDLDDARGTNVRLTGHLLAAAERAGHGRDRAHLFHLDVHEVRGERAEGRALFQFSVPVVA
ncbi:hypothetical protein [Micromonospora sp. CA-248212]|uniref:hypothetical protein n=1 Tax=Micromonospora sp. CA-248212 TaxID=3239961 RepID=UPI003D8A6737